MKVIAINGSPRKHFNTATLLEHALRGAAEQGAETRLYHLADYTFSPCRSCLICKSRKTPQTGLCVLKDDLTPIIRDVLQADAVLLGSPIYFYTESASFRALLERLLFPLNRYTATDRSLFRGIKPTGLIYTMNITEEEVKKRAEPFPPGFSLDIIAKTEHFFTRIFGFCETMLCNDTMQVKNYADYYMDLYDSAAKAKRHEDVFPHDCEKAYSMGISLTRKAASVGGNI